LRLPAATDFHSEPGQGARASVDGATITVGRAATDTGIKTHPHASLVAVRRDNIVLGHIALEDRIKSTTPAALRTLRTQGISVEMVTGDRRAAAARIAHALGIDAVHAEVTPERKQELVKAARQRVRANGTVVFAGDGINDAPALAAADVGVA